MNIRMIGLIEDPDGVENVWSNDVVDDVNVELQFVVDVVLLETVHIFDEAIYKKEWIQDFNLVEILPLKCSLILFSM